MVMVPAVIMGVVGCKISCLTSPQLLALKTQIQQFLSSLLFSFWVELKKIRTLSHLFCILCLLSLDYCIAFFRIISFSLNLKSLIITAQQDSSVNGPGARDLYALTISKVSISSQSKMAFNFSFFLFIINKIISVKVSSRNFSHHLFCQIYIDNLYDCGFSTACSLLEMFVICCLETKSAIKKDLKCCFQH